MVASKNSALEVNARALVGDNLDINIANCGNVTWVRASSNLKNTLRNGTEYTINQISERPAYLVYRVYQTGSYKYILQIKGDGIITITPQVENIPAGTGINFSELFIRS